MIAAICSKWESHNLFRDDKDRGAGFEYGEIGEEIEERIERLRDFEETIRIVVGRGEHKIVESGLRNFLRDLGLNVSSSDPLYAKLRLAFARTVARTAGKQLQRAEGLEVPTPDVQPIPGIPAPCSRKSSHRFVRSCYCDIPLQYIRQEEKRSPKKGSPKAK
ncbi:hypothetical protein SKTS_26130 [Sulfurimicrobium lacus]|uniref:Uncharacterized protein n=1 Tax=Sulfurimicrobium lacus TaxID=2715678 RepID=A0A6F8VF47_9PROT|nr:hypothetical protein [Sulfurimicrobium lacus]BCB27727.1 hypothetical protein SKTS_26130 [Sulfurimicrobium lacus]